MEVTYRQVDIVCTYEIDKALGFLERFEGNKEGASVHLTAVGLLHRVTCSTKIYNQSADVWVTIGKGDVGKIRECKETIKELRDRYGDEDCYNGDNYASNTWGVYTDFVKYDLWGGRMSMNITDKDGGYKRCFIELPISPGTPFWIGEGVPKPESEEPQYIYPSDFNDVIDPDAPTRLRGRWYAEFPRRREGGPMYIVADTTGDDTILIGPGLTEDFERWRKEEWWTKQWREENGESGERHD